MVLRRGRGRPRKNPWEVTFYLEPVIGKSRFAPKISEQSSNESYLSDNFSPEKGDMGTIGVDVKELS